MPSGVLTMSNTEQTFLHGLSNFKRKKTIVLSVGGRDRLRSMVEQNNGY